MAETQPEVGSLPFSSASPSKLSFSRTEPSGGPRLEVYASGGVVADDGSAGTILTAARCPTIASAFTESSKGIDSQV